MNKRDATNELVSALLDDELRQGEAREVLDLLEEDPALRTQWDRYHLIGDIMRGEAVRFSAESIADRVRSSLEQEVYDPGHIQAIPISRSTRFRSRWIKPAGGAALAASVALISVLALPQLTGDSQDATSPVMAGSETAMPEPVRYLADAPIRWKNLSEPAVESKLNRYLIEHSEFADPGGMAVSPYTNFVSYDSHRR